ncbi:hypothetical protein OG21DRAFT_1493339 [Imleria badia]|nr:hypothetical protein OG21DRAFT_1493339 [Imleria badia]
MKLQNLATLAALVSYALGFPHLANFPEYRSLAGLSRQEGPESWCLTRPTHISLIGQVTFAVPAQD